MPPQEMRVRVEETLDLLDLAPLRGRRLATLSGGEKQRVAIAAALALRPQILVLDEPTSQLDPKSAEDVLNALVRLNHDLGLTVLLAEHRLERVLAYADRMVWVQPGRAGAQRYAAPGAGADRERAAAGGAGQAPGLVAAAADDQGGAALQPRCAWHQQTGATAPYHRSRRTRRRAGDPFLAGAGCGVRLWEPAVLKRVALEVRSGEIVALMGRNGAGKTTLLKSLVGLVRPTRGQVRRWRARTRRAQETAEICRTVAYLPQDPNALLFADTVERGVGGYAAQSRVERGQGSNTALRRGAGEVAATARAAEAGRQGWTPTRAT